MKMRSVALLAFIGLLGLTPSSQAFLCGEELTQLTVCFPGSPTSASCEYAITNNTLQAAGLKACPQGKLFGSDCTVLPGLLSIAYGPCQEIQGAVSLAPSPLPPGASLNSILGWLEVLGLQSIEEVGALLVRGYAFQSEPAPSQSGLNIIPNLAKIGDVTPVTLDNARLYPLTILGAVVPQFPLVNTLEAGMLIENVPNTNFSTNFHALSSIDGPVVIVGNPQLTSLEGLQGILVDSAIGNLQIIGNPRLTDISALEDVFDCGNSTDAATVVGAIEVIPSDPPEQKGSCLLSNQGQVCEFINSLACPNGTVFGSPAKAFSPLPALPVSLPLP